MTTSTSLVAGTGGWLEAGESPFLGLRREVREEVSLEVTVRNPVFVHQFIREDGQVITMIAFWCEYVCGEVKLGSEHTEHLWLLPEEAVRKIDYTMKEDFEEYINWFS